MFKVPCHRLSALPAPTALKYAAVQASNRIAARATMSHLMRDDGIADGRYGGHPKKMLVATEPKTEDVVAGAGRVEQHPDHIR